MYVFFKQNYCKGIVIFFILFIFFSCDLFGPGPTPPPTAEESPTPTPKSSVTLSPLLTPPETQGKII